MTPRSGSGPPETRRGDGRVPARSTDDQVAAFLRKVAATPVVRPSAGRGRLVFAMDATASREPTWDRACHLQADMFHAADGLGGLEVQLVFYRGYGECKASPWLSAPDELVRRMVKVRCLGGRTQLRKVLDHAIRETGTRQVNALVFVGDCFEEDIDGVCHLAGELGIRGVPAFLFQEGADPVASRAFRQVARLSGGAHCGFDLSSARQLRELLSAVAVFAAGGRAALEDLSSRGGAARLITSQIAKTG